MSGLEGPWRLSGPPPRWTDGETEAQGARSDAKPPGKSGELSEPVNPYPHLKIGTCLESTVRQLIFLREVL